MANIYLRVPHYVASYLRNKDRLHPLPVGEAVPLNPSEKTWLDFTSHLYPNAQLRTSRSYVFCQRQWSTMMEGRSLQQPKRQPRLLAADRYDQLTLSDREVQLLSGLAIPRGDETGEYICLRMPREAMHCNRVVPVTTFWQLNDVGANLVRADLVNEFWRALYAYMDRAMDVCRIHGTRFAFMQMLESFMERFDVRCSPDRHEREALKRNYYRRRKEYRFTDEDIVEFGDGTGLNE